MKKTFAECAAGLKLVAKDVDMATADPNDIAAKLEAMFEEADECIYSDPEDMHTKSGHFDAMILEQRQDFIDLCDEVEHEYGTSMKKYMEVWL